MGVLVSRFISRITRTKTEDNDDDTETDFLLLSRNSPLPKSIQVLVAACFNCAIFVVVGMAVKSIAGPAMILSVVLGAFVAMLNNLSLTELCTRFPTTTSFYSIIYVNVGELCAFMVGWFRVLQNIFMISIVSLAAGEYIRYLAEPALGHLWSPSHASWTDVEVDALVFTLGFLSILSLIVAAGLPYFTAYLMALFWSSLAVFLFLLVVIISYASSIDWSFPTEFQPFNFGGTMQGVAITMFFFANLDRMVEQTASVKNPDHTVPVSLAISLLIVLVYYLCSTLFVTVLAPIDMLSQTVTIPEEFALTTFHASKYILSSAAIIIFCLTTIESYFGAQKPLNLLAEDGLLLRNFLNPPYSKKQVPVSSVLVLTFLSVPLFMWLPMENMIQGYCVLSLLISIIINCSTIVVQYRPETLDVTSSSVCPSWESTKTTIIRFLLCFGYITHKRVLSTCGVQKEKGPTEDTGKLVNWSIISYIPSCGGLALAMFHGLPVVGWKRWIVLAALGLLLITIFLTVRIIMIQPRRTAHFFENDFLGSLIPLLNIGLLSILVAAIDWMAFPTVGVWLGLGLIIYFVYGISHSNEAFPHQSEENEDKPKSGVQFDEGPEMLTNLKSVQPENTDVDRTNPFLFSEDSMLLDFPQKQ